MKRILVSFMMAFVLVSCSTEELGNGNSTPASKKGGVQLVLSTDGFNEVGSRAVDESVIHDVNILEYINGILSQQVYLDESKADFSKAVEVTGLKDLDATKLVEETDGDGNKVWVMNEETNQNFIFIVANYGSQINAEDIPHLAELKKFKMKFASNKDLTNLPMTGFYYGGINSTSTTQMSVTLQRAVAKINFTLDTSNFKVGGITPSMVAVNRIRLCNVPGNVTLYPCKVRPNLPKNGVAGKWWNNDQTLFPTAEEMNSTGGSVEYTFADNLSSTANTYVAYIPENARGSYDDKIKVNKEKHPSNCGVDNEKDDKCFTYILVDLDYVMANGTAKKATYRIYLGGNSTGDMNLLRNTQYNVTTNFYGANIADTRISVTDAPDIILDAANCYMIDMSTEGNKNFIIPLSQVNKGWAKIVEYDKTQEATATQVAEMLKSGKWEIKTLWKTWQGSNITGTKVTDISADNLNAALFIPADIKNGNNAVVELVSTEDNQVYWSWHLWFTDYKPNKSTDAERKGQVHQYLSTAFTSGNKYANKSMMDRNLGATITGITGPIGQPQTSEEAVKYYGLFYQYGRKDPFVGSRDGGSTVKVKLYNDKNEEYVLNGAGVSTLVNSFLKPGTYFVSTSEPFDWTSPQRSGLWSEDDASTGDEVAKSPFDPCPAGWRVPTGSTTAAKNPWSGFGNGTANSVSGGNWTGFTWMKEISNQVGTAGRLYSDGSVQAWYPACGYLHCNTNGGAPVAQLTYVGIGGNYNSATPIGSRNYRLVFLSGGAYPSFYDNYYGVRAFACPIRCVQE